MQTVLWRHCSRRLSERVLTHPPSRPSKPASHTRVVAPANPQVPQVGHWQQLCGSKAVLGGFAGGLWSGSVPKLVVRTHEEVSRAYKRMQAQVIEGNRNRLPDSKTLEVASFVWNQERLNGYKRPKWRVLCERWNKEHSDHQFASWRHFRTSFERADKAVKELNFDWS